MKLFISHATEDEEVVKKIVDDFLYPIGLHEDQIFCSSLNETGIPIKENIYDYIKSTFQTEELYVLFILSDAYYESVACLNEMGAAWVMKNDYMCILLPGFKFEEIKGAIDPRRISIKIDSKQAPSLFNQFKNDIEIKFGITNTMSNERWERQRNALLRSVVELATPNFYVDISKHETLCIGDQIHRGCTLVEADNINHRIITKVDFSKTLQDLCSTVIFPAKTNWKTYAKAGKSLAFQIRIKGAEQIPITLEVKCEESNGYPRKKLFASVEQTEYKFKLLDLETAKKLERVKEICFLVYRDIGVQSVEIEISEIRII